MRRGSSRSGRVTIKREAKADPDTSGPSSRRRSDVNVNTPRSSAAGPSATTSRPEPREYGLQEMREKIAGYMKERELTRMRQGPLGHAAAQINAQELDEKIADVVRYMLAMQHKQPDVPVPRTKLNELCAMEGGGKTAKLTSCVLQGAQACLAEVFGMHMQELERGASKLYVLRSLLPASLAAGHLGSDALDKGKGFTAAVLALIHLNGGKATDEELEAWLRPLGVDRPAAGGQVVVPELAAPLEEVLKDLERQHYLTAQPCDAAAPQGGRVAYTLGLAAQDRLPEAAMKQLISRVFGDGPSSLAARNAAAAATHA